MMKNTGASAELNIVLRESLRTGEEPFPNRLVRFINALTQAIGIYDPDLQHGRIGREEADNIDDSTSWNPWMSSSTRR